MWTAVNALLRRFLASLRETRRREAAVIIARYQHLATDGTQPCGLERAGREDASRAHKTIAAPLDQRNDFTALRTSIGRRVIRA